MHISLLRTGTQWFNYLFIHLRVFDPQLILLTLKEEKDLTCVLKVIEL